MEKNLTKQLSELLTIQKEIISSVERSPKNEKGKNGYENNRNGLTVTSSMLTRV